MYLDYNTNVTLWNAAEGVSPRCSEWSKDFIELEAVEDFCVTCHQPVKKDETALACELCERWKHMATIKQCDKLSEALYSALVGSIIKHHCMHALWAKGMTLQQTGY